MSKSHQPSPSSLAWRQATRAVPCQVFQRTPSLPENGKLTSRCVGFGNGKRRGTHDLSVWKAFPAQSHLSSSMSLSSRPQQFFFFHVGLAAYDESEAPVRSRLRVLSGRPGKRQIKPPKPTHPWRKGSSKMLQTNIKRATHQAHFCSLIRKPTQENSVTPRKRCSLNPKSQLRWLEGSKGLKIVFSPVLKKTRNMQTAIPKHLNLFLFFSLEVDALRQSYWRGPVRWVRGEAGRFHSTAEQRVS